MVKWNYRGMVDREGFHSVREVFYDDDGTIESFSANPSPPFGESPEELIENLGMMMEGLKKPFMLESDFISEDDDEGEVVFVSDDGEETKVH